MYPLFLLINSIIVFIRRKAANIVVIFWKLFCSTFIKFLCIAVSKILESTGIKNGKIDL